MALQLCKVESVQLRLLLVYPHLLSIVEFPRADWANVNGCLSFHLSLPRASEHFGPSPLSLLLAHFFVSSLVFFHLQLVLFPQLLHRDRGPCFFLLDLFLPLAVVVVVLLLRPFLSPPLSLAVFVGQRLEVVVIRLIS